MSEEQGGERKTGAHILISIVCPSCGYDPFVRKTNGSFGCARCRKEMSPSELLGVWCRRRADDKMMRLTVMKKP